MSRSHSNPPISWTKFCVKERAQTQTLCNKGGNAEWAVVRYKVGSPRDVSFPLL